MTETLIVEVADRVASLTINRERQRNALDDATITALRRELDRLAGEDVAAIVLAGAGKRAFSAGSDIKEMARQTHRERVRHTEIGQALGDEIEQHPAAVIAAIEGYCLGGGLEIASCCDLRIAGADAVLGVPELAINALPSWGGTVRLPRLVGIGRARELVMFGRRLTAAEALDWGLVARVVPAGEARAAALEAARQLAATTNRDIMAIAKGLLTHGTAAPSRTGRQLELLADMSVLASEAHDGAIGSFGGQKSG